MTPDEFQSRWEALPRPASATELEAAEVVDGSGVWVARDSQDRQHLLVRVPDAAVVDITGTHGLGVTVGRLRIAARPDASYMDIVCLDQSVAATFAAVAADIADAAVTTEARSRAAEVVGALNEWRWFWGVDPTQLSITDAIGLFGELWFMLRWAGVSATSVRAWEGSEGARHDFQWPERSVEVKVTSRSGPIVHTIQHLQQLADPEVGDLYLYSLRLARDALAANTLRGLAEAASSALAEDPAARAELFTKLGKRGYTPAGRDQAAVPYRVVEEGLYRVSATFPRLTSASFPYGVPPAIISVSYQLDMNACADWRVATAPSEWPP